MALPELDLMRIKIWCDDRWPKHLWDQVKVEADVTDRHVTIVEVRPPWDGRGDHTRWPVARLRYTKTTGLWSLYWRDRNLKFHEYDVAPTAHIQDLLDHDRCPPPALEKNEDRP